ncbi:glutamate synthase subunit beta [bacterium]|nr:glutamate synthase subunit beta [bacterium]
MGKLTGFMEIARETGGYEPVVERVRHYREFTRPLPAEKLSQQGARCMDCGTPFCHTSHGCPLANLIPEWNDHVYRGRWKDALFTLLSTNNFPEFTGRVCPAPCETACVLGINADPVAIKQIEEAIIERGFGEGWMAPRPPAVRTGRTIAVVGSGPAGLAAADQLNQAGHSVTVLERDDRIGGLLTYGIPDFKLDKRVVERRLELMRAEGVVLETGANVGVNYPVSRLLGFDAICLCGGATAPRDLAVPGRELAGIHFAMPYLTQQNRRVAGLPVQGEEILATGKHVIVIGGGDTGSDCVGTANRQGAKSVTQLELLPLPPAARTEACPWPYWPLILRTSSSHEEGCARDWAVSTKSFSGRDGKVEQLHGVRLEWSEPDEHGRRRMREIPGSEFTLAAELVLLAMGFLGPEKKGLLSELGVELDERGNVKTDGDFATSVPGVFAAGDMRRGQSLVVWAIAEGRRVARAVDLYLMGSSNLSAP